MFQYYFGWYVGQVAWSNCAVLFFKIAYKSLFICFRLYCVRSSSIWSKKLSCLQFLRKEVVFHFKKLMLSSNLKQIEVAFHFQTSAVAQHKLRPNKLNWTHNYNNKFTFLRFLYSLPNPYHHQSSLLCLMSPLLHCTIPHADYHVGMVPFPVTMWYSYFRFWLFLHGTFEGSWFWPMRYQQYSLHEPHQPITGFKIGYGGQTGRKSDL